jgi:catechol 2,3-dioxygenase-like lactoylglutathione lyase family enzyme
VELVPADGVEAKLSLLLFALGRGVYFEDPDGHLLEIITRPYGSGG